MKLTELPDKPGVYLFMDSAYNIIYVGKAKSVKKRVKSHFGRDLDARHLAMISQVRTVDCVLTKNEKEALVLEDQLIKEIKPRYNIALRDGKTYPYLEITAGEKFPVLKVTRKRENPDSIYFGPFPNVRDMRAAKRAAENIFPLRKCKNFRKRKNPCLNYQIGKCLSPCTGKVDEIEYREVVDEIILFFSGQQEKLLNKLEKRMNCFKEKQEYEKAAAVRDRINELNNIFPVVSLRKISKKKLETLKKTDPHLILKSLLKMEKKPEVIEGFDISHTSKTEAVGSMVYFKNGEPDKSNYRKFRIRQGETADDLKMLKEVIYRRISGLVKENLKLPDIIFVDGGKGQEKTARSVIESFNIKSARVLSLAKEKGNIYYKGKKLDIPEESEVYKLIKRVDDEAHRFAHTYHLQRRKKKLYRH